MRPKTKARLLAIVTTVLEIVGAATISGGVALISIPAGVITAGVLLIAISYLLVRGGVRR